MSGDGTHATATVSFSTEEDVLSALTRDQKALDGNTVSVSRGLQTTLWITNFSSTADKAYIEEMFSPYGEIVDVRFPSLVVNNKRRFCYLQYKLPEQASAAVKALHDKVIDSKDGDHKLKKLVVKISDPSQRQGRQGATYEGREVYVRNISEGLREADIQKLFEKYGNVEKIRLPSKDPLFHMHQGYGFVTFAKAEEAKKALELDFTKAGSKVLNVSLATPKGAPKRGMKR